MKWKNRGHEYDALREVINRKVPVFIWGAGVFGQSFCRRFLDDFPILAFADNDPEKWGSRCCGMSVLSPDEFLRQFRQEPESVVLVSAGNTGAIYAQLSKYGLRRQREVFHIDEWASVYMMCRYDRVYVNNIDLTITEKCTLHCQHCNAFVPLIRHPADMSMDEVRRNLELYFQWVDEVGVLAIDGGDAMLHPQFAEILTYIGDTWFPDRVRQIEVYSNAVLAPSPAVCELFRRYKVLYRFTDYSSQSGRQNIEKVTARLREYGIPWHRVHFESWYDCGYPQESNGLQTEDELASFFDRCDRKSCQTLLNGKLLFCGICAAADSIGYCALNDTDCFDLTPFDRSRRWELLEYSLGYNEKGYMNYCRKCNGSINVNTHRIIAGRQSEKKQE